MTFPQFQMSMPGDRQGLRMTDVDCYRSDGVDYYAAISPSWRAGMVSAYAPDWRDISH